MKLNIRDNMVKLNLIGSFFGIDGYSVHTRSLANAIQDTGIEVSLTVQKPAGWEKNVSDQELKMLMRDPLDSDMNLMIAPPYQWAPFLSDDKPFIGFVVWEGDRIPVGWLDTLLDERVTQIWVPSKHTYDAVLNTANQPTDDFVKGIPLQDLENKIRIIPHGVDTDLFYPVKEK